MDRRVLVAGEADEAHLALLLGLVERLQDAALGVGQLGIVVEGDAVDLPQVEMVGLQPAQRLLEHLQRQVRAAAVRADLGHQEDLVAPALEGPAQPVLGSAVLVLPAVVEEGDAGVDGLVDEPDRLVDGLEVAEVVAADTEGRHLDPGATERPSRISPGAVSAPGVAAEAPGAPAPSPTAAPSIPTLCMK